MTSTVIVFNKDPIYTCKSCGTGVFLMSPGWVSTHGHQRDRRRKAPVKGAPDCGLCFSCCPSVR